MGTWGNSPASLVRCLGSLMPFVPFVDADICRGGGGVNILYVLGYCMFLTPLKMPPRTQSILVALPPQSLQVFISSFSLTLLLCSLSLLHYVCTLTSDQCGACLAILVSPPPLLLLSLCRNTSLLSRRRLCERRPVSGERCLVQSGDHRQHVGH